jgi:hypothetical protein
LPRSDLLHEAGSIINIPGNDDYDARYGVWYIR